MTDVRYQITAPAVSVTTAVDAEGNRATIDLYAGATLPADVPAEQLATLIALGHITERPDADEPGPAPADEPTDEDPTPPERPADSGKKTAWVDYAVNAHGADRAEAEKLTRDELVAKYGGSSTTE